MAKARKNILVTAALPYINNVPHLGHIVGSHLPADIFARYCRAKGYKTLFIGGTDENGSTSEIAAEEIGVDIGIFCDKLHKEHKRIYDWFNISYDNFSRTTRPIHHKTTQEFFKKIYGNGFISEGKIKVFYSPEDKRFLPDRYVRGTCPKCGYEDANADQCEKCTSVLDTTQLINPKSAITGKSVEIREAQHLFLRLDKLSGGLEKWLKEKKNWRSQVTSLALGWIKEGLRERCITRDLRHGVKVPLKGFEDKVFYVWFDAPIGYISSTKEADPKNWEKFWKDKNTKIYHFLGKDNIPFHTIFWPGMLMAHGEFSLPYHVEGLQYLNYEGGKFSKSKRRGVFCEKLPETGIEPDIMRAYLTFLIPETADAEFRWDNLKVRINSDIIGNFANFINRSLSLIYNYLDKEVIKPKNEELSDLDRKLIKDAHEKSKKVDDLISEIELKNAFVEILNLADICNKYFDYNKLWKIAKEDKELAKKKLYLCVNLCRTLAILSSPYLPSSAQKIWDQLNLGGKVNDKGNWDSLGSLEIQKKHTINKPYILFSRLTTDYLEKFKKEVSDTKQLKELFE